MKSANNRLLVSVDLNQKSQFIIGDRLLLSGRKYSDNFREKVPVVAEVLEDIGEFKKGQFIVTSYTHFDIESPYLVEKNIYSIPIDELILAIIDEYGGLIPVCGNLICERIRKEYSLFMPPELIKNHDDRGIVLRGTSGYKNGDFIFWLPMSDYEICYTFKGKEKRAIKVYKDEIVGILEP